MTSPGPPPSGRSRWLPVLGIGIVALGLLLAGVVGGAGSAATGTRSPALPTATQTTLDGGPTASSYPGWAPTTPSPRVTPRATVEAGLRPLSVSIGAIGVRSDLLPLAVDGAGVLVPPDPYDVAGWFTGGPVPGQVGPAVIAGHVDSQAGPGVFFRLEEMAAGDTVEVARSDGSVLTFEVTRVEHHPKNAFPTARVYGPTPRPELRLITCGGDFDRSRRSYLENVIVFAVLRSPIT